MKLWCYLHQEFNAVKAQKKHQDRNMQKILSHTSFLCIEPDFVVIFK